MNTFEKMLLTKRDELSSRIKEIHQDKTRKQGPLEAHFEEQAIDLQTFEVIDGLDSIERKELDQINEALIRIKNKTFGICIECGVQIEDKRLSAVPYTKICLDCSST